MSLIVVDLEVSGWLPMYTSRLRNQSTLPSRGRDVTVYVLDINQSSLLSLFILFCVYFCLYGPFNCISFHKFSRQLSAFSLLSSGLFILPYRSFQPYISLRKPPSALLWHRPTELAHFFLFCSCIYFCLYGPFNCILFHKFSRQLSVFSLCSSGLTLPYWSFQLYVSLWKSPSALI